MTVLRLSLAVLFIFTPKIYAAEPCYICNFPISELAKKPGKADACEDLFGASCLNPDGSTKNKEQEKIRILKNFENIKNARDAAAKAYGYKDARDGLQKKLKSAGLPLKEPVDEAVFTNLLKEPSANSGQDIGRLGFDDIEQCNKTAESLSAVNHMAEKNVTALKAHLKQVQDFYTTHRKQLISSFTQDIPGFFSRELANKCSIFKTNFQYYPKELNPEIAKTCANLTDIKIQASKVYRAEGTADYNRLAQDFVKQHIMPDLKQAPAEATGSQAYPPQPTAAPVQLSEDTALQNQINAIKGYPSGKCIALGQNYTEAARKITNDYLDTLAMAKPTVDHLTATVYTSERKKRLETSVKEISSNVQGLVRSLVKDPQKRGKILDQYDRVEFGWIDKLPDSAFEKNKQGIPELKVDSATSFDPTQSAFSDGSLSFFTNYNAFYNPRTQFGDSVLNERITMMPRFLELFEENPLAVTAVIAHELGHKIAPQMSTVNGHSTKSEFAKLLACYKDNKSIKMEDNQSEETISDYVSSEVLAHQLSKLPKESRKSALVSALEGLCNFAGSEDSFHFNCKTSHPFAPLRVSGIYGANPNLRKAVGCEGDSKEYKSCGMNLSILDKLNPENAVDKGTKGTQ